MQNLSQKKEKKMKINALKGKTYKDKIKYRKKYRFKMKKRKIFLQEKQSLQIAFSGSKKNMETNST